MTLGSDCEALIVLLEGREMFGNIYQQIKCLMSKEVNSTFQRPF